MCNKEIVRKIDNGEILAIRKIHLVITIIILIVGISASYSILQAKVTMLEDKTACFEKDRLLIREIKFNLRRLVIKNGLEYIEGE